MLMRRAALSVCWKPTGPLRQPILLLLLLLLIFVVVLLVDRDYVPLRMPFSFSFWFLSPCRFDFKVGYDALHVLQRRRQHSIASAGAGFHMMVTVPSVIRTPLAVADIVGISLPYLASGDADTPPTKGTALGSNRPHRTTAQHRSAAQPAGWPRRCLSRQPGAARCFQTS